MNGFPRQVPPITGSMSVMGIYQQLQLPDMRLLSKPHFRAVVQVAVLALLANPCRAQVMRNEMARIVQPYVDAQMFMGSVLVAKNGKIIFSKSYGMADLEWSVPNSPTTRFNIASMTKQFTAASILLLEERGKLKTDDLV